MARLAWTLAVLVAHGACNELADFLPHGALSMAMPNDIMKVDWAAVDPSVMGRITADNLKLLTHCANIRPDQIARIPSKAMMAIEKGCVASLTPEAFAQLRDDQLAELPSSAVGSVRAAQVTALHTASCTAFARSDLFKHFTLEVCAGMTPECLKAIPPLRRAVLKTDACIAHASSQAAKDILTQTPAVPDNIVDQPAGGAADAHAALMGLFATKVNAAMTRLVGGAPAQAAATTANPSIINEDVLKKLDSCAGYGAADWAKVPRSIFAHMTARCLSTMSTEGFAGISAAALGTLPPSVVAQITEAQVKAMDPRTCAMFASTDAFEYLPASLCSVLSPECVSLATSVLEEAKPSCISALPQQPGAQQQQGGAVVATALLHTRFNVIEDVLPAAAVSVDPASHATVINWEAVPAEMFAKFRPDDLKLLRNCAGVSAAQIGRILPEAMVDLNAECLASLPPAAFAGLDIGQLLHIQANAIPLITAGQLAMLPPERCAAFLQSDALDSLTACDGLTAACANLMRADDLTKVQTRTACKEKLPADTAAVLDRRMQNPAVAALRLAVAVPSFVPQAAVSKNAIDWNSIDAPLFAKMTDADMALLTTCAELKEEQVAAIPAGRFEHMSGACLATLRPSAFAHLSVDQVMALPQDVVRKSVTASQLGRLDTNACNTWFSEPVIAAQFATLTEVQESLTECVLVKSDCSSVSAPQLASVNTGLVKYIKNSCFLTLSEEAFKAFTPNQINHLGAAQAVAITPKQLGYLTPKQCAALEGSDLLKHQTGEACGGWTAECVQAMGTEAVKYIAGNHNCYGKMAPAVQGAIPKAAAAAAGLNLKVYGAADLVKVGSCSALSAAQVAELTEADLKDVSAECLQQIPPASFAGFAAAQIKALPGHLGAVMSADQLKSLTPTQCAQFDGSTFFKTIDPAACAGFSSECFSKLSLEAVKGVMTEACFVALDPETKLSMTSVQMEKVRGSEWFPRAVALTRKAAGTTPTLMNFLAAQQQQQQQQAKMDGANPLPFITVIMLAVSMTVMWNTNKKRRMASSTMRSATRSRRSTEGYVEL